MCLQIQALCRAFDVPIHVIQRGPPTVVSHGGANDAFGGATTPEKSLDCGERVVRISYHRRMYGLGEVSQMPRRLDLGSATWCRCHLARRVLCRC